MCGTQKAAADLSTRLLSGERGSSKLEWSIKALSLTDLTTLAGDDTNSNVDRLCVNAAYPFSNELMNRFKTAIDLTNSSTIHTAAVCVYPSRVKNAYDALARLNKLDDIQIAAGKYF